MKNTFLWNNEPYEKFYIIRNADVHAGFCALILYVLNGIRKAVSHRAIPVVHFDRDNTPDFYDKRFGESVWEYFFEPVSPYSMADIQRLLKNGHIASSDVYLPSAEEIMQHHHDEKERLATFWAHDTPVDKEGWMKEKRGLGRIYVERYIRVKPHLASQVDRFVKTRFAGKFVLGVHIRGTDFAYATATGIASYLSEIERIAREYPEDSFRIFLATDQEQYLALFKSRFGARLLFIDAMRSANHIAPFRLETQDAYQKGADVITDILILSRCNYIIKGAAAVGEMALWFNGNLQATDFSVQSDFCQKPYHELESAFFSLNIGNKSEIHLMIYKICSRVIRRIVASDIGFLLYRNFKFFRNILRH